MCVDIFPILNVLHVRNLFVLYCLYPPADHLFPIIRYISLVSPSFRACFSAWLCCAPQLVDAGCNVIALSRKGAPENGGSWVKTVKWVKGNALVSIH